MKQKVCEQHQVDFEASLVPRRFLWFPAAVAGFPCPFAFFKISHDPCVSITPENLKRRVRCSFEAITVELSKLYYYQMPCFEGGKGRKYLSPVLNITNSEPDLLHERLLKDTRFHVDVFTSWPFWATKMSERVRSARKSTTFPPDPWTCSRRTQPKRAFRKYRLQIAFCLLL